MLMFVPDKSKSGTKQTLITQDPETEVSRLLTTSISLVGNREYLHRAERCVELAKKLVKRKKLTKEEATRILEPMYRLHVRAFRDRISTMSTPELYDGMYRKLALRIDAFFDKGALTLAQKTLLVQELKLRVEEINQSLKSTQ